MKRVFLGLNFLVLLSICEFLIFVNLVTSQQQSNNSSNDNDRLASVKDYKFASVTQYKDFQRKHRKIKVEFKDKLGIYHASLYLLLHVQNISYKIDLTLKHYLVSKSFGITAVSNFGKREKYNPSQKDIKHCYYQGFVRGIQKSKVVASTCRGLRGTIFLPPNNFIIEPLSNGTYIFYKNNAGKPKQLMKLCPENNNFTWNNSILFSQNIKKHFKASSQVKLTDQEQRYVELALVASKLTNDHFSGNRNDIQDYLIELVNYVDGYYQEMNIHVVLIHIEIWMKEDFFKTEPDGVATLRNFAIYRVEQIRRNPDSFWFKADAVHVIHTTKFENSTVGVAATQTMCSPYASAIIQYQTDPARAAITLTHELGHNFGLLHVNENGKRICACPLEECVMNPTTGFRSTGWSKCSINNITENFKMGFYECLFNIPDPVTLTLGSGCGNTVVELGEQCDCGFKENCQSKCCNPETCQLFPNATCDNGFCCENCRLRAANTPCRGSKNECDLPETCSGTSPHCPKNVYKEDGTTCFNGQAYCSQGACITLETLCKYIFGPTSTSPDFCYDWNTLGNAGGNCGLNPTSIGGYKECAIPDKFCGKLICFGGHLVSSGYYIKFADGCQTISHGKNEAPVEIGLIPNGTVCGLDRTCQDKHCKPIPTSKCDPPCGENLICNNLGNCHFADEIQTEMTINLMEGILIIGSNLVVAFVVVFCSCIIVRVRKAVTSKHEFQYDRMTVEN